VIHNFFNVVLEGEKPLIPGEAVLPSIRFIEDCYQNRSQLAMPWNENLETLFDE
jgi:ubiquitin